MRFFIIVVNTVLVFFIAKTAFQYFSGREGLFLINIAPAGIVFIYGIGYLFIADMAPKASSVFQILVGAFVVMAMIIHSATINVYLDGAAAWRSIAIVVAGATLLSTLYVTKFVAELEI